MSKLREWLLPIAYFSNNLISRIGILLVTAATVFWIFLLPQLLRGSTSNPYIGILLFFGLPAIFISGLVLIPVGVFFARRKAHARGQADPVIFDFRDMAIRRLLMFIALATAVNIIIVSQLSYSAVRYMETSHFCGQMCHVMNPEFTAYRQSPHSNVPCSECHVGAGATGFVMAKLAGTRQLLTLTAGTYPRPIPVPENMLPATETCQRCHSAERFVGDRLVVHHEYAEDEQNSVTSTVLRLKVGGGRAGIGIHGAHMRPDVRIEYVTTGEGRKEIPQVSYIEPNGKVTVYKATDSKLTPAQLAAGKTRSMDCMDCHNRPTHVFQVPERAVDQGLAVGQISAMLPFVKREALAALKAIYPDRATAAREIESRLTGFYRTNHAQIFQSDSNRVQAAIAAVQAIYARNVFPEMKVNWGTYPSQLGHNDSPGCFRCHDGNHGSADGRVISNDCATCHEIPAMQEKNPKILTDLGMALADPASAQKN
jgi:nitrate/TMAO reductase-like tetraheme cytochrome c subunit